MPVQVMYSTAYVQLEPVIQLIQTKHVLQCKSALQQAIYLYRGLFILASVAHLSVGGMVIVTKTPHTSLDLGQKNF